MKRYSKQDHDRALERIWLDMNRPTKPPRSTTTARIALVLILALAVLVLLSGCNTIAGIGADLHDLARGAQDRMADDPGPEAQRR